jgi:flavin-binding protein dodecin
MSDHIYSITEIVGSSAESLEDAIRGAVQRANQTVRGLDWFEVTEIRGHIENGEIGHFQVGLKIGFRLEEPR